MGHRDSIEIRRPYFNTQFVIASYVKTRHQLPRVAGRGASQHHVWCVSLAIIANPSCVCRRGWHGGAL